MNIKNKNKNKINQPKRKLNFLHPSYPHTQISNQEYSILTDFIPFLLKIK